MSESQDRDFAPQWQGGEAEEDTISILVATDNHLGYLEKDPIRGDDSFAAFEEILALAVESQVDMILLGGDLFHENKPSRKTMYITTKLLRKYCLGDKPVSLEFLSEPSDNFPEGINNVNYMDPNLNVAIPVFSIHGNHDDPSGDGNLCALDQLAMAGLVNYFGRSQEIDNVIVNPVLLQKGSSRLALYGIGNIRDERLHQTFLRRNVKMMRPVEDEEEEPWYNLLVLHQNRVMHGPKNFIPEAFLDDFINLVIWGHEHECLIDPVYNPQQGFHVSQPGSSVATSLSEGESKEKHVAILKICKGKFNIQKIRLQSVRPFVMGDVTLSEHGLDPNNEKKVSSFISKKVRDLVQQAKEDWVSKNDRRSRKRRIYSKGQSDDEEAVQDTDNEQDLEIPKPLIRLRVEYSGGFEIFNPQRFGQEFVDIVANPRDIVHFYRRKTTTVKSTTRTKAEMDDVEVSERLDTMRVENLVQKYLSAQNLSIFPEIELADAVRVYVEKDEKDAVKDFVVTSLDRMQKVMRTKQNIEVEEALLKEINKEKDMQAETYAREYPNGSLLDRKHPKQDEEMDMDMERDECENSDSGDDNCSAAKQPKSRGSNKKSSNATKSATRSNRSSKTKVLALDSQDDEDDESHEIEEKEADDEYREPPSPSRSRRANQTHVVLDTDDEDDVNHHDDDGSDEEEMTAKPSAKGKGKPRAKSPTKPKPAPKPTKSSAGRGKKSTATGETGTDSGKSSAKATTSRTVTPTSSRTTSQSASQGPSQTPSRLVSSIGSRKKKLM
ncbi:Double-strand break repair protein mre11a [Entomortierella chlamydospora]|nr:Double-strand break repair protein mre11a [Entomortierella chlamydospora]